MESEPGKGTTVRVYLPAEANGPRSARPSATAVWRSSVLVVDDDPMILRAIERALLPRHDPTCVQHPRDALELIGRADRRFDAVVCDLLLPGMSGMDFHAELEHLAPRLARATLFLTSGGYSDRARSFLASHPEAFLEKPFQTDQLLQAVGQPGRLRAYAGTMLEVWRRRWRRRTRTRSAAAAYSPRPPSSSC